jgi:hypothetical protein
VDEARGRFLAAKDAKSAKSFLTRIPQPNAVREANALVGVRLRGTETLREVGWSRLNH